MEEKTNSVPSKPSDFFSSKSENRKVRRLNNLPLIGVFGIIALVIFGIIYTIIVRQQQNAVVAKTQEVVFVDETPVPPSARLQGDSYIPPKLSEILSQESTETPKSTKNSLEQKQIDKVPNETEEAQNRLFIQLAERRLTRMETALNSDSAISFTLNSKSAHSSQAQSNTPRKATLENLYSRREMEYASSFYKGENESDPNMQGQKIAFLSQSPDAEVYLKNTHQEAIKASLEIKAGTIIPGVMISGINSDLPGQIIAQVKESVYDSATGQNVLIPLGSKLVGTYDSRVATGQRRALIAWSRIIYPDGSSLSLGNMPGSDQSGYAGFQDKVNNHYLKIFGNSLLLSVISGASQLSQNTGNTNALSGNSATAKEMLAAELGRQWGEVGMEMTKRNLNIQPTIIIRPGYNFNVMVTKDIILPPWQGHPMAVQPY